jgi:hypothetical protein
MLNIIPPLSFARTENSAVQLADDRMVALGLLIDERRMAATVASCP